MFLSQIGHCKTKNKPIKAGKEQPNMDKARKKGTAELGTFLQDHGEKAHFLGRI
jgi:hypothetical protein